VNSRERYLATLHFQDCDRLPFMPGGGRESTLRAWHAQGLPQNVDWLAEGMRLAGIPPEARMSFVGLSVDWRMMPQFEEKVLEHRAGHYIVQDWKGNVCEISDAYDVTYLREARDFVTRRWIKCPVESRQDWLQMRRRYDLDAPGRFPDDFADRCRKLVQRDGVLRLTFSGPFWQMREWCGFEGLCMMMIEQPDLVDEMAAFWTDFVTGMLQRIFDNVVPDAIRFNEDMAYKAHSMISPAMTRRFCMPSWQRWSRLADEAGCPMVEIDSDGCVEELIPLWIESGIRCNDPVEVAAHNDIVAFRRTFGRGMAYQGGIDKRAMARGGQALIDEMQRVYPVARDGGYIPGCDHAIPGDVPWPHMIDYLRMLAEMTRWL
jgi:hypothetical protein